MLNTEFLWSLMKALNILLYIVLFVQVEKGRKHTKHDVYLFIYLFFGREKLNSRRWSVEQVHGR
jgi:hypothetical protein